MIHVRTHRYEPCLKSDTCPVNKAMTKINEDHMDKTRLKLDEKDIFESGKKESCCERIKKKFKKKKKNKK